MFRRFEPATPTTRHMVWELAVLGDRVFVHHLVEDVDERIVAHTADTFEEALWDAERLIRARTAAGYREVDIPLGEQPTFAFSPDVEEVDELGVEVVDARPGNVGFHIAPTLYTPPDDLVVDGKVIIPEVIPEEILFTFDLTPEPSDEDSEAYEDDEYDEESTYTPYVPTSGPELPESYLSWNDLPPYVPLILGDNNGFVSERDGYIGLEDWLYSPTFATITTSLDALSRRVQWEGEGQAFTWVPPFDGYATGLLSWTGPQVPDLLEGALLERYNARWSSVPATGGLVTSPERPTNEVFADIVRPAQEEQGAPFRLVIPAKQRFVGDDWFSRIVDAVDSTMKEYRLDRIPYLEIRNRFPDIVTEVLNGLPQDSAHHTVATVSDAVLGWMLLNDRLKVPGQSFGIQVEDPVKSLPDNTYASRFFKMLDSMERSGWVVVRDACCGVHAAEEIREIREFNPDLENAPVFILIGEDAHSRWSPIGAVMENQHAFSRAEAHMLMVAANSADVPAAVVEQYGEHIVYVGVLPEMSEYRDEGFGAYSAQ